MSAPLAALRLRGELLLFAGREAAAGRAPRTQAAAAGADYVASRRTLWH